MEKADTKRGALWSNQPKSDKGPVLIGEIDGQRVSVFKNEKWSEEEKEKQPLYLVHRTVGKAEDVASPEA